MPDRASLLGRDRLHGIPGEFEVFVCAECGSGRTLPDVAAERLGVLYPDAYNAYSMPLNPLLRLLATGLFETRYWRALRADPLGRLRDLPPGRALDVGSGRGDFGVVMRRKGWEVVGLEPSVQACEVARQRGVTTELGTLETTGAGLPGGFDAVVFNHSLEHVVDPARDLLLAHGLLRDGGLLLVSVPNFGCWQRRWFGSNWLHLDLPRHRSHFSPQGLETLLNRTGFSLLGLGTSTSADGLPLSLQYQLFGRRRFAEGPALYASIGLSLALAPLSWAANSLARGGDFLHAVACTPTAAHGSST
jgi:SAM-dependent methyltransferase